MRHMTMLSLLVGGALALGGCGSGGNADVTRAIDSVAAIDQENMQELMLAAADPAEAVSYFSGVVERNPESVSARRGLARSLMRSGQSRDALPIWRAVIDSAEGTNDDRVHLAEALIRDNQWSEARAVLDAVPPTHETFDRYRLEAMIADSTQQWDRADHFYDIAVGLTTRPAGVYNNWGFSKLSRGEHAEAERHFTRALQHDPGMFTAKTNLVLARAARRHYSLPLVEMTQIERAQLLHTMAISAIRQGDVAIGRGLLVEAIDTHPQFFEEATRALRALESNVGAG